MEKKEEISTNEYLRGIVLNLPESPGIYQYLTPREQLSTLEKPRI